MTKVHKPIEIGDVFGRLTVKSEAPRGKGWKRFWNCTCQCGKEKSVYQHHLNSGAVVSCGCYKDENTVKRSTTHGKAPRKNTTPEYKSWASMLMRCNNPNNSDYSYYGGRGIRVCERWVSFENFLEDMGLRPTIGHSLDRINNELGYSKENCRWATKREQSNNTRRTKKLEWNGVIKPIQEWAEIVGIKASVLQQRISRRNWTVDRALSTPLGGAHG